MNRLNRFRYSLLALACGSFALGVCASACSSAGSGGGTAGGAAKDASSNLADAPPGSGDDAIADAGANVDCGHPARLLDAAAVGLHCPNVSDAGKPATCAPGEHCCEQSSAARVPSTCALSCAGADAEADWACQDPSQCGAGGSSCCGIGVVKPQPGCGFARISAFAGTRCATTCMPGEFTVCEMSSECAAGQTCVPARARGGELGVCQP
jgi:hypothetical protein